METNLKDDFQSFGKHEEYYNVADEADPTVGWINLKKDTIHQVPNEEKRFNSFWKGKKEKYLNSDSSQRCSERTPAKKPGSRLTVIEKSNKLNNALAKSRRRMDHFKEYKSKSPLRNPPQVKVKNVKDTEK